MRRLCFLLSVWTAACAGSSEPESGDARSNIVPGADSGEIPGVIDGGVVPDAPSMSTEIDASVVEPTPDGGDVPPAPDAGDVPPAADAGDVPPAPDAGAVPPTPDAGDVPPAPDPDAGVRFLTAPPPAACTPEIAAQWVPAGGFSGGIPGTGTCGPSSPNCPTAYIPGNSGAACTTAADCVGLNPVCLTGPKYGTGTCAATGCELGSNFGCPAGAVCINGGEQTYCVGGCGIEQSGCFVGCAREGFACFNTESPSLGTCFAKEGVRQCDPSAAIACTMPSFGDGICVQTSWDDQTVGRCFETCNPIAQDCTTDGHGCYVLREYSGYPVCFQSWGYPEGTECDRMTECAEGLRCACDTPGASPCPIGLVCRRYCDPIGGTIPCPEGTTCTPLATGSVYGSCLALR